MSRERLRKIAFYVAVALIPVASIIGLLVNR
jgi:hypothetical protein